MITKKDINDAIDELAEALADFDAEISPSDTDAYLAMRNHVEQAQKILLGYKTN